MTSTPWALKKMLNHLQEKYKNPIVMIHENGNITWNTANNRASTDQTVLHFYCNNHTAKMIESSADKQSYCNNHTTKMIESSTDQPFYCNSHTANNKSSTDQQFYCISSDIIYTHSATLAMLFQEPLGSLTLQAETPTTTISGRNICRITSRPHFNPSGICFFLLHNISFIKPIQLH